jgi:hypothetical protein
MLHRFYNPSTGRWISRDPIGERGGMNLHGFVANDPRNRSDRHGLHIVNNEAKRVYVEKCEIVVLYGHGSRDKPWTWAMSKRGCNAGSVIMCWPKSNSQGLCPSLWPHDGCDDEMVDWAPIEDINDEGNTKLSRLKNATKILEDVDLAAFDKALDICKSATCCCSRVNIRFVRIRRDGSAVTDPSGPSDDSSVPNKVSLSVNCKTKNVRHYATDGD